MLYEPRLVISANCIRRADFTTRIQAAAAAGFTGVGIRVSDYVSATAREGLAKADLPYILRDHGLEVYEVEATWDWTSLDSPEHIDYLVTLREMRKVLEFRQFNAFIFHNRARPAILQGYRELCDALPDVPVGLEHIGYGPIVTLEEAVDLVRSADRANARIILDSWHFHRTGSSLATIMGLDPFEVGSVQISDVDATPHPDMAHEARHARLLPETGASDLTTWLATVLDRGIRAPISIEVVNDAFDAMAPTEVATRQFHSLTRLISSACTNTRAEAVTQ